jgi:hypothetical protein
MVKTTKSEKVPKDMQVIYDKIVALTDEFGGHHLNDEYTLLARYAIAALCRKRPSPLISGSPNTWACGIVYALGFVNFLFDKSQTPYMNATDLCKSFGVSKSTGAAKAKVVRDTLGMVQLDPNWCLPSKMDDNPMAWIVIVNGMPVDARHLPRELQEVAYKKGIIPYIPADKKCIKA